ncbi:MAG: methyltransferase domain-containing protein [archaeon]|nr:methyltransferase domain-containing protein [archaeon]
MTKNGKEEDPLWDRRLDKIIDDFLHLGKCDLLLDVGCGSGFWMRTLMRQLTGTSNTIGIDYDKSRILSARKGFKRRTEFVIADAQALPFKDGTFDIVTCRRLLMNVKHKDEVLGEMIRVSRFRGICSCVEPDFKNISEFSSVQKESDIYKKIESDSEADLEFGPKAASLFLKNGLQEVDVWSYCMTNKTLPPYGNVEMNRLHGSRSLEDATKKLLTNISRKEKKALMMSASKIDEERKKQIKQNKYSKIEIIPFVVTKGTKSKTTTSTYSKL